MEDRRKRRVARPPHVSVVMVDLSTPGHSERRHSPVLTRSQSAD